MDKKLLEEYEELEVKLNNQMWKVADTLPDGVEECLTTIEKLIKNIDKRLRLNKV